MTNAAETGNWGRGFDYDSYGNMWVDPVGNGQTYGIAPAGNTPTSNIFSATTNQMTPSSNVGYDSRGNQSTIDGSSAAYDAENHLGQYVEPPSLGGLSETYEYDGLGRRVAKLVLGATVAYVYDGLGQLAAEYTDLPSILAPCQTPCYPAHDHLGSVRLVTDINGNISGRHDYLPFGEEIQATDPGRTSQWGPGNDQNVPTKFTGQLRDPEIALDDFGARRYGFALGRFTSVDPENASGLNHLEDPQSWNAYSYVRNNPLKYTDPDGQDYNVCDAQGQNCRRFDNPTWANSRDANGIQQAGNGDLSVTNDNGSVTPIGNAQYFDPTAGNAVAFLNFGIGALSSNYLIGAGEAAIGIVAEGLAASRLVGAALQGGRVATAAGRVIKVVEEAGGAIHLEITSGGKTYEVIANIERDGGRLVLDGAHIEGSGAGQFGAGMVREIREAARQFAAEQGATEVTVNPGIRTSGANPGRAMRSFTVRVE